MNIFSVNTCPIKSAQELADTHTNKMFLESCQMLLNAFTLERLQQSDVPRTKKGTPYLHGHPNHPCTRWTIKTLGNFNWLLQHCEELKDQRYSRRYNPHFTEAIFEWLKNEIALTNNQCLERIKQLSNKSVTPMPVAIKMSSNCRKLEDFDQLNHQQKYKAFYIYDKDFASWDRGVNAPDWFLNKNYK
jgi:Pyrimidine dimer DNA glycosylase